MSVYKPKRSPHWHYDFVFKGQRYCSSTGCGSRREAEAFERRVRHEIANPTNARPPITLDEACGLYAEHAMDQTGWNTTKYMLAAMLALGKNRLLSEITQRDLQVYRAKRRNGRSNATINRELNTMRAVWRRAQKARFDVGEMPDWGDLFLKVDATVDRELAEDEEAALFAALDEDARDVVRFALISGWRKSEVIGLRWADLDLAHATAKTRIKGGDTVRRPLTPSLVALVANQPKVGPFVFTYVCRQSRVKRRKGQRYPFTGTVLRQRFEEAREAAGIDSFRFHDLRHTAATRMLRRTGNLAGVGKVLAHRNIKTTQRYAHVSDEDVRATIEAGQSRIIPELPNSDRRKG